MYPDLEDVQQTMHKLAGGPRPEAKDIWPTVVRVREFVSEAYQFCRNHGRHKYTPASELLQHAEKFIGRTVSPYEFCLTLFLALPKGCASSRMPYAVPIDVSKFDVLKIKFPPLDRIEEMLEPWKQRRLEIEQEIQEEMTQRLF